ncbi:hypothetical protein Tco_1548179 [Tanacetum coccineum]
MKGLATHVWYLTSHRIPAFVTSSTSLYVASLRSGAKPRFFCVGSICLYSFSLCLVLKSCPSTMMVLGILVMSASSEEKIIRRVGPNDDDVQCLHPRVRNFSYGDFQSYLTRGHEC